MVAANNLEILEEIGPLAILESLGDAISIQDTELRVLYQNPSHRRLMGNQVGHYCYEAYQKRDDVCPGCHLLKSFKSGKANRREGSTPHSTRGFVHVEIISTPLKNAEGKIIAGVEAVRDITEQKLMREKLNAITTDLEQRSWRLMAVNKELESFSYTLSHDIRNYIARISMAAQALNDEFAAILNDKASFLVGSIEDSCNELEKFVEAILLLCSSDSGEHVRETVDLTALAGEVVEELRLQFPERCINVAIAPALVAEGDRQLLKVVLQNIFGNAWKYTVGSPQAQIGFSADKHGGETVFVIRDNGCGFDMKEAASLFKPFGRLSSSRDIKGTGIGLATVSRIIQSHGGAVWAEGEPGRGAAFYFTLATDTAQR